MTKRIEITCDQFGRIKVDAQCFSGTQCAEKTAAFEMLYAGGSDTKKPEYYDPANEVGQTDVNSLRM